ncbi:DUF6098 family protein [Agromyces salentinus]|uniref:Uncharacterized protein n=1 Tax=Agromyces salentinus TaxID=269421 RepID=A0ABN2MLM2_9MICO|nr:DUF6098 family protein [Agromyces salentinus]
MTRSDDVVSTLDELHRRLGDRRLYVRYSEGPDHDLSGGSVDTESGLELPGLSVNPLDPEPWWTRPVEDWLARQLCQYKHLRDRNQDRRAWLVHGSVVGRGPDCEPLLTDVSFVGVLDDGVLGEAEQRYREHFDAGNEPE